MKIYIPFQDYWREKMLNEEKLCTTLTKIYGRHGDTFQAFGANFIILQVGKFPLWAVKSFFYSLEGCRTPEEFEHVWCSLHPRRGFLSAQVVYPHLFRLLRPDILRK